MNLRKIKLALTVDLMNSGSSENPLHYAESLMKKHHHEAGDYLGTYETKRSKITENMEQSRHEIKFDRCTLDLDLISDNIHSKSLIQGFELHETLS